MDEYAERLVGLYKQSTQQAGTLIWSEHIGISSVLRGIDFATADEIVGFKSFSAVDVAHPL